MAAPKQKLKVASKKATGLGRIKKFKWWQIALVILAVAITGIAILRLSHASDNIDDIYKQVQGEQAKARAGQGNNEGVTVPCKVNADGSRSGAASGWAYDPLNPAASTQMHLYFDAPGGPGFPITANLPSGDVNAAFNIGGAHRYLFPIPPQYYDGAPHSITAYAIGSAGNNMVGWIVFRCYPKAATPPPTQPPTTPPPPNQPPPTTPPTHTGGTPQPTTPPPPVNPAKVSSVVSLISKGIASTNGQASGASSTNNNPTQLATVDLLDTSKNLSSTDLIAIDKKIDDIPADKLSTLTGTVTLKPNIPANKNVVLVGYYLNKKLSYYTDKAPFDYDFDTTRLSNGTYRLDVVGFDKDGNQVTRLVQKFNVENHLNFIEQLRNDITYPFYKLSNPN